jgi:nitroimidazol reductase NimA-like FMN-containing flavoprotein (pyridoxamine 5'-phosphate oxidase superfamily)
MSETRPPRGEPRATRPHAANYQIPTSDEGLLSWDHVERRLRDARTYWLATTCPDGRPHVAPVWGAWVDGAFYFDGISTSRWARNLAANPAAALHLESGEDVAIIEGTAEDLPTTDAETAARIAAAYIAKYNLSPGDRLIPQAATSGIFRLHPRVALGWTDFPADATRWGFEGANGPRGQNGSGAGS